METGNDPPDRPAADAEAALPDERALWEAVCRITGDIVIVVDAAGTLRFCNRYDPGWSAGDVVGRSVLDLAVPESAAEVERTVREVLATGEKRELEVSVRTPAGELSCFALRVGPVRAEGRVVAVMACCENIEALKTSERSLARERNVLRRLLEIQERERQLVSYEIHDGLAQYLAGAIMHFQAWEAALGEHPGQAELHEGMRLLQAAADESRRLIGGLRPPALDELGIIEAIESLVSDARAEVAEVVFRHDLPGPRLPAPLETAIFRIVQESLSNVRKHAEAGRATVEVSREAGLVRIRVSDDGRGFDLAAVPEDRFGLEGIRQRARLFGGEPRIEAALGRGCTIEVALPVPADQLAG
jgi:PAS domain S-box-containing protein